MKEEIESADVILGEAGELKEFTIRWGWMRLKLKIKPITTNQLIRISREVCHVTELNSESYTFPEILNNSKSLYFISKAIAIATGTRYIKIVAEAIRDLPLIHVKTLWSSVISQSDPESFFFIIISARGMNKLKKKEEE